MEIGRHKRRRQRVPGIGKAEKKSIEKVEEGGGGGRGRDGGGRGEGGEHCQVARRGLKRGEKGGRKRKKRKFHYQSIQ